MESLAEIPSQVQPRPLFPPIKEALCDDLNTPAALAELHKLRNSLAHGPVSQNGIVAFSDALRFFGFLRDNVTAALEMTAEQRRLFEMRRKARAVRNWAESDRIRDELATMGIDLKDNKDGTTTWEVKR
jgi:cysteinyl-tRNA synthetase